MGQSARSTSPELLGPGSTALSYDVLRRAAADPQFLARWAMSYVRRSEFGPEWETTGPGLGD